MKKNKHTRNPKDEAPREPASSDLEASLEQTPEIILLCVTGMSPAILTETVWALAHEDPPVVPNRLVAVTTTSGRDQILKQLFEPLERFSGQCAWECLRSALESRGVNLNGRLRFGSTADDIRVITACEPHTTRSFELPDIRTPAENEAAADFLLDQVRTFVENPNTQLIASIAGGRKTMGALLYACMTLIGRETDRLTHVLVSEPFETLREFFFPSQPGGALSDRDGQPRSPAEACVDLADVPFVPLRTLFLRELGQPAGTFSRLVQQCRTGVRKRAAESLRITVDRANCMLEVNGRPVKLGPREHLWMLFLAELAKAGEPPLGEWKQAIDPFNAFLERLRTDQAWIKRAHWRLAESVKAKCDAVDDQEIRRAVSNIRQKVRALGLEGAAFAACLPEKHRFSLEVPRELIHLK